MRPYHQYPLLLGVSVSVTQMDDHALCTNVSQIFTNISVYHGEEFKLSACVVGYDLGTTSGSVYANFSIQTHTLD